MIKQLMNNRDLEYLIIELSWKSSSLEGNSYSQLDTELLLKQEIRPKQKTDFETQMILNHKIALEYIIDNPDLFKDKIMFRSVEHIHKLLVYNLGINSGIRRRVVKISSSNYQPISVPFQLREQANCILNIINNQKNPKLKALLAFCLMPYLQPFEDGNKRVGRLLANAILIHSLGVGMSLKNTDAKQLALGYLSFYEFSSLYDLLSIFNNEFKNVENSCSS